MAITHSDPPPVARGTKTDATLRAPVLQPRPHWAPCPPRHGRGRQFRDCWRSEELLGQLTPQSSPHGSRGSKQKRPVPSQEAQRPQPPLTWALPWPLKGCVWDTPCSVRAGGAGGVGWTWASRLSAPAALGALTLPEGAATLGPRLEHTCRSGPGWRSCPRTTVVCIVLQLVPEQEPRVQQLAFI